VNATAATVINSLTEGNLESYDRSLCVKQITYTPHRMCQKDPGLGQKNFTVNGVFI